MTPWPIRHNSGEKMIIKFQNEQDYQQWLRWQSFHTREKAKKFAQQYGNVLPIVIAVDAFTPQGGEWAEAYVFVHPSGEEFLNWVVAD